MFIAMMFHVLSLSLLIATFVPISLHAEEAEKPKPAVKRIGDHRFRLGLIEFDSKTKEVIIPAVVNMREGGPIEYVLVQENGKVHESILTTPASPLDIQIAMNLLSYEAGKGDLFHAFLTEEAIAKMEGTEKRGDSISVLFRWKKGEAEKESPVASMVIDGEKAEPMSVEPWVYTGSTTENGNFMAETEGSIIAVYLDHLAIFNMSREGAALDERWGANDGLIPEIGTKGTVILKKAE